VFPLKMSTRTVGLVIAMSTEARALTGRRQPLEQVVKLSERVYLRVGGVGARAAERSCAALVEAGAGALVSVGCAAGLTPECRPGALVVPAKVHSSRGEVLAVDGEWRAALLAALEARFSPLVGDIAGVDHVVGSAEKHHLRAAAETVAADMESAAVAVVAKRLGVPMIAIRAVSDGADDDVPGALPASIDAFGRARLPTLLNAVLRRPGDAAGVMRLRTGFNKACRTLSLVAADAGLTFCWPDRAVG
jgi:adenosylhomocysteine nucleosidase